MEKFRTLYSEIGRAHTGHQFTKDKPILEYTEDPDGLITLEYVIHTESGEVLTEDVYEQVQLELENVITPQKALLYEASNNGAVHPNARKGMYGLDHTNMPQHSADVLREVKKAYSIMNSGFIDSDGNVKDEYIIKDEPVVKNEKETDKNEK